MNNRGILNGSRMIMVIWVLFFLMKIIWGPQIFEMFSGSQSITITNSYRLLTCSLLHQNMIHLLINMLTIYFVGSQLEPVIKPKKFLLYLVWEY